MSVETSSGASSRAIIVRNNKVRTGRQWTLFEADDRKVNKHEQVEAYYEMSN